MVFHNLWAQSVVKISGIVSDAHTMQPLASANVILDGTAMGTTTDVNGRFSFENILDGSYRLLVHYMGYHSFSQNVTVQSDHTQNFKISLKPVVLAISPIEISAEKERIIYSGSNLVIHREAVANSEENSVGGFLKHINGIDIRDEGGLGGSKKISIRGAQANQALVIVDGLPLNDQLTGEVDLSTIPLESIQEIEIIKGAASAEYGSGALGGVIKITTISSVVNSASLNSSLGSFGYQKIQPGFSLVKNQLEIKINTSLTSTKGNFPYSYTPTGGEKIHKTRLNADVNSTDYFAKLKWSKNNHSISSKVHFLNSTRGLPGKINYWTPYAKAGFNQILAGIYYDYSTTVLQVKGSFNQNVTKNSYKNLWQDDAPLPYKRVPQYHTKNKVANQVLHGSVKWNVKPWASLKSGINAQNLTYRDEDKLYPTLYPIGKAVDNSWGAFTLGEFNYHSPENIVKANTVVAVRYAEMLMKHKVTNRNEQQVSPSMRLHASLGRDTQINLSGFIGRSFRAPTFADLFYQQVRVQGKPDLLPETGLSKEIGVGFSSNRLGDTFVQLSLFDNKIDDLIVWRLGSFETFQPFNTNARIKGIELNSGQSFWNDMLNFSLGMTKLDPRNKSGKRTTHDKILPYRSRISVKGQVGFHYSTWQAGVYYRFAGKRFVTESNTIELDHYEIYDFYIEKEFTWNKLKSSTRFTIQNTFDEQYELVENMPMPPLEWIINLRIQYK